MTVQDKPLAILYKLQAELPTLSQNLLMSILYSDSFGVEFMTVFCPFAENTGNLFSQHITKYFSKFITNNCLPVGIIRGRNSRQKSL